MLNLAGNQENHRQERVRKTYLRPRPAKCMTSFRQPTHHSHVNTIEEPHPGRGDSSSLVMMLGSSLPTMWRAAACGRVGARELLVAPRHYSSSSHNQERLSSTSALDHKLSHRHGKLPPLPAMDRPIMEAGYAVSNILYNTPPPSTQPFRRHILNMFVQDEPGVLARVSGCLAARGVNIDSLVVCATDVPDLSRMCIVLRGQKGTIEQVRRQLEDLVPVWAVVDYSETKVIEREIMLVKVSTLGPEYFEAENLSMSNNAEQEVDYAVAEAEGKAPVPKPNLTATEALTLKNENFRSIKSLAEQFDGRIVDVSDLCVIVQLCAKSSRLDSFFKLIRPFGILELSRSGTMVLPRTPIKSEWKSLSDREEIETQVASMDASLLPPG